MISLENYFRKLSEYENNVNLELIDILKKAKVNFTYKSITITSCNYNDDDNYNIKLLIKGYNGSEKDRIMEITCRNKRLDTLTYQNNKLFSGMIFERAKIDRESLKEIIILAIKYKEFYQNGLSYERIMRKIRHLPDHLPFYDHVKSETETEVIKGTMLDEDRLPSFLDGDIFKK